ncbi:MAG: DinB family protein [Bryobacteraceae bacterium]|nr:DinB family protein [Bryobacteraceae bacterium]
MEHTLAYLQACEEDLLAELRRCAPVLNRSSEGGAWSPGAVAMHLIRTEVAMYPLFAWVPKLARWPRLIRTMDTVNRGLWLVSGMRTVEGIEGRITAANATSGRFLAPGFLRPGSGDYRLERLLDTRRAIRDKTLRAVRGADPAVLARITWSHPLLGPYTLLEFVEFLGVHEQHHLPQIRRTREAAGIS